MLAQELDHGGRESARRVHLAIDSKKRRRRRRVVLSTTEAAPLAVEALGRLQAARRLDVRRRLARTSVNATAAEEHVVSARVEDILVGRGGARAGRTGAARRRGQRGRGRWRQE